LLEIRQWALEQVLGPCSSLCGLGGPRGTQGLKPGIDGSDSAVRAVGVVYQ